MGVLKAKVGGSWVEIPGYYGTGPRGLLDWKSSPGINSVGASETDVPNLSVTWVADPTRYYCTTFTMNVIQNTSAGLITAVITDGGGLYIKVATLNLVASGEGRITLPNVESSLSAGEVTRKVRISTSAGTVNVQTGTSGDRNAQMTVEDIGGY